LIGSGSDDCRTVVASGSEDFFQRVRDKPRKRENMDPQKTAVVLIEYQNDFTSEGGSLHDAVKGVMANENMLLNTVETVEKARELGATIIHAPITFTPDYHELSPTPYGILKGVVESKSFRKGTWGAEIVQDLTPAAQDIVIEGKRGLDAFASTNLDFILRSRGITTIVLGGFLTNCCVESTMRTGYEKGFAVVTLNDCTATLSEEEQRFAIEKNYPMFSRPMNHQEFLAELSGEEATQTTGRGYSR
jgi:ureidoacrylate peracid hydrolase